MVDRLLLFKMLEIMCQLDGLSLAEHILINTMALQVHQPFTPDEAKEQIRHASDKGWITKSVGLVGETRWARTLAGKAALEDLRHP